LFTEQFRYDARGRTTAHMQSFGASTGAADHARVWGLDYDERGHVAQLTEARGVTASQWESMFATTAALPEGADAVAAFTVPSVSRTLFTGHAFQTSSLGTLLGEQSLAVVLGTTPEYSSWTATRAEGAIMPSSVNGAGVAWDALGRMESHDGLNIDDWSFDHRMLQATRAATGTEPAASERYIYDIHGRPVVLDVLDATGIAVERVARTWWGDRCLCTSGA